MQKKRQLIKYKVSFKTKSYLTYGRKKTIWREDQEWATSLKDAKEWVKVLKKDKRISKKSIKIVKLTRKEWF